MIRLNYAKHIILTEESYWNHLNDYPTLYGTKTDKHPTHTYCQQCKEFIKLKEFKHICEEI